MLHTRHAPLTFLHDLLTYAYFDLAMCALMVLGFDDALQMFRFSCNARIGDLCSVAAYGTDQGSGPVVNATDPQCSMKLSSFASGLTIS